MTVPITTPVAPDDYRPGVVLEKHIGRRGESPLRQLFVRAYHGDYVTRSRDGYETIHPHSCVEKDGWTATQAMPGEFPDDRPLYHYNHD